MRINCLGCGHTLALDEAYDDYHGQVKCNVCGTVLDVASKSGKLESVKLVTGLSCYTAEERRSA